MRNLLFLLATLMLMACGGGSTKAGASDDSQTVHEISDGAEWDEINESESETIRKGFSSEYNYKGVNAGITAKVINGEVSISFDQDEAANVFGETAFVLDESYAVEGLSGMCKGVFIGDVGQDYNPVLCCLLEDGGVEVLALYPALRNYGFSVTIQVPLYKVEI